MSLTTEIPKFTATKFMSVKDKITVFRAWRRFLKSGFNRKQFTMALYRHLTLHCSFIAHYDIDGFYAEYFSNPADTLKFIGQFDPDGGGFSVEYGSCLWLSGEHADLNEAMRQQMGEYKDGLVAKFDEIGVTRDAVRVSQICRTRDWPTPEPVKEWLRAAPMWGKG